MNVLRNLIEEIDVQKKIEHYSVECVQIFHVKKALSEGMDCPCKIILNGN